MNTEENTSLERLRESLEELSRKVSEIEKAQEEMRKCHSHEMVSRLDVSQMLGVSPRHVSRLVSKGHFRAFCPGGKKLYFQRSEVESWMRTNAEDHADR